MPDSRVLVNAAVTINSVDLSVYVRSATLTYEAEILDASTMGVGTTRANVAGLLNWSLEVTFLQAYGAGLVDATLFALVGAVAFPVTVKRDAGATSATNPLFSGNAVMEGYNPLTGEVGALQETTVTFRSASALTRATS